MAHSVSESDMAHGPSLLAHLAPAGPTCGTDRNRPSLLLLIFMYMTYELASDARGCDARGPASGRRTSHHVQVAGA